MLLSFCLLACGNTTKPGRLVWSDEFDYTGQPDSSKWNFETGDGCPKNCGWGNNEAEIYTRNKANVRVENKSLIIEAIKSDGGWTSAKITSHTKMHFTYGRLEFRAKLPVGKGTWPAIWMLGESVTTKGWPDCGEIDIMEHVGKDPGIVQSVIHNRSSFGNSVNIGSKSVKTSDSEFHLYGINWTKGKIEFFIDDVNFYTYQPTIKDNSTWPFDEPFYLIMNIAMGGNLGGPYIDPALTHARMEVDYVRVYQ